MSHATRLSEADTLAAMRTRIAEVLPEAEIAVRGGGGHFEIDVVSAAFDGLNTLKRQRLVYSAIKELMAGDDAPVHAVDRMRLSTPQA